ncbi:efflux RND transporter periplasmic adaptor subunit [Limisphaera sp. 4302-co]|uniref:efflux RND transporter periplasmic adaptor subunit n=1 Tax=Limisphaera sp. 4302-co TaxID=3400417 RepID=UPI003C1BE066
MSKFAERLPAWLSRGRLRWMAVAGLLLALLLWWGRTGRTPDAAGPTFTVRRGPLEITVLESGNIEALESQEIKCEVRVGFQGTKILRIVEEGHLVTEEDVKQGKILVELDSSEIEKQLVQQEIQYQNAVAGLADAEQNYQIQLNQNLTDIAAAEQRVRFARMDFDKLLGDQVAESILHELNLDAILARVTTNALQPRRPASPPESLSGHTTPAPHVGAAAAAPVTAALSQPVGEPADPPSAPQIPPEVLAALAHADAPAPAAPSSQPPPLAPLPTEASLKLPSASDVDFSRYASLDTLGDGEAKQRLRQLEDNLQVARKELEQATATLEGTRRLFEKGFVTRTDLQRDEIAHENSRLKVQTAETARALYLKYEFPRTAEETLSKYLDAIRELDKTRRQALARLAQAEARLRSAQAQYQVQRRQLEDLQNQLTKCVIRAQRPGLVVYGSGRDDAVFRGEEAIREGATVRERQTIITIPDMTRMAVNVRIHETYIQKIHKGQKARITVDAFPDRILSGEVTRVAVLPDSQNRWFNPEMKVYNTTVTIQGTHEWLKPGMSAKVEILVDRLEDVLYVPVQAVVPSEKGHVCYVLRGRRAEPVPVQIGQFNDEFIEIRQGLQEGQQVLLHPPLEPALSPEPAPDGREPSPSANAAQTVPATASS